VITRVIPADDEATISRAADVLAGGGLLAFPTDTVYGLGCHALLPAAVERIFEAKMRPKHKAIPLLVSGPEQLVQAATHVPGVAHRLIDAFWPGGLTIVLAKHPSIPDAVTAGGDTVALRMPDHAFVLALIEAIAAPIAATSANLSDRPPATSAAEAVAALGRFVELVVDGGPSPVGVPSTVLDLTTAPPEIVRPGAISPRELGRVVGCVV